MANFDGMKISLAPLFTALSLAISFLAASSSCVADSQQHDTVGVLLPLSGGLMDMGNSVKRGMELYQIDHPDAKTRFVYEDTRYEGKTTVSAFHSLRDRSKASLVIVWGNTPADTVAPVAEQLKTPLLAITMNPVAKDREFVLTFGSQRNVVESFAKSVRDLKAARPGAVSVDLGNALEILKLIENDLGQDISEEVIATEEVDFKSTILKLKAKRIDSLILFLLPQQALTFLKQSKQMNFAPNIIGGDIFASDSFRQQAARITDKCSFVYGGVKKEFVQKLRESPEGSSYFFEAATGYSIASMVEKAMSKQRDPSYAGSTILDQLTKVDLSESPISQLKFANDPKYGRYFESEHWRYGAELGE